MVRLSLPVILLAPLGLVALLCGCATTSRDVHPQTAAPGVQRVQRQTFVRTVSGVEITIDASELGLAPAPKPAAAPASADASADDSDDSDEDE